MSEDFVKRWKMMGGNTCWVKKRTLENMDTIYNFLLSKTDIAKINRPRFTYSQLSKHTGIDRKQVQYACQRMAYRLDPVIKITARKYVKRSAVMVAEEVHLLRTL